MHNGINILIMFNDILFLTNSDFNGFLIILDKEWNMKYYSNNFL